MIICFGLKVINGTKKAREVALCGRANTGVKRYSAQCLVWEVGWEALTTLLGFMTNSPEGETGRQPRVPGETLSFPRGAASNRWQRGFNLKILKHRVSSKPRQLQFYCLHSQKKNACEAHLVARVGRKGTFHEYIEMLNL